MNLASLSGFLPTILFPLLVFLGGCCFGPSSSAIKLGYAAGFSSEDMVLSQYAFGCLLMLILSGIYFAITHLRKVRKTKKIRYSIKDIILLISVGVLLALVSLNYLLALQTIPAYLAVILLFQYTWIGIIAEAIMTRKMPNLPTIIAVIILISATILASGIGSISLSGLDPIGVMFGMLSAVFYAGYILLIGKLNCGMSPVYRSMLTLTVALAVLVLIYTPYYFTPQFISESIINGGLWMYGVVLGCIGCALPNFLFAIGVPKISGELATILSSSELPASIICAVIIISEQVSWLQWIGVFLLFFGIALPYLTKVTRIRPAPRPKY